MISEAMVSTLCISLAHQICQLWCDILSYMGKMLWCWCACWEQPTFFSPFEHGPFTPWPNLPSCKGSQHTTFFSDIPLRPSDMMGSATTLLTALKWSMGKNTQGTKCVEELLGGCPRTWGCALGRNDWSVLSCLQPRDFCKTGLIMTEQSLRGTEKHCCLLLKKGVDQDILLDFWRHN